MTPHLFESAGSLVDRLQARPLLLALDFDGTLSPIAATPDEARIHPAARLALERLSGRPDPGLEIAIVSGRPVSELRERTPPADVWIGLHGMEIVVREGRASGTIPEAPLDDGTLEAIERVRAASAPLLDLGARFEDKGVAVALHTRGLDPARAGEAAGRFREIVEAEIARGAPLHCLSGKAVVEARPRRARKDLALRSVLEAFGEPSLVYAGDDATDEDVFRAFPEALTVAVMDPPRATAARSYVRSPEEVAELISRCSARSPS